MAYVEDDLLYVTTKVEKYRGYICAFRAPWVNGRLGKEEPRPTHAKDVEVLLREYLLNNVPKRYDVVSKTLCDVCVVDSSALVDESRQWVAPTSMVASETPHHLSAEVPELSRASETLSSSAVETPRTGAAETPPPSSTTVDSGDISSDARTLSESAGVAGSVPSVRRKARRGRATRCATVATDSNSGGVGTSESNLVGNSSGAVVSVSSSSGGGVSTGVSSVSSNLNISDEYGSGINTGANSFIGLSGFVNDTESEVRVRRRSAPRAPLNVGTFGNIQDTLRLLRDPPSLPPLEKLAYLSAQETLFVDLPDSHPLRWLNAKKKEVRSLVLEHDTWDVTTLPPGRSAVDSKWVNTAKTHPVPKDKSRYIARGFRQRRGVDYSETYAPVAKLTTLRIFLTLVTILGLFTSQLDIKTAFLNATLEEEIYISPTSDLIDVMKSLKNDLVDEGEIARLAAQISGLLSGGVLRLKKALYGLKQAPRQWWKELLEFFTHLGFVATAADACLLVLYLSDGTFAFVLVYVDDLLLACSKKSILEEISNAIKKRFRISSSGELDIFLGINITFGLNRKFIELGMRDYIEKIFKRFGLVAKQSVKSPMSDSIQSQLEDVSLADSQYIEDFQYREKIGSLIYLMICVRPDIAFAVGFLARFCDKVNKIVCSAVTRLLQYVYNTKDATLKLSGETPWITLFTDSDWAGCRATRLSTGGFIMFLGSAPIAWGSKLQKSPAQSVQEAEYMAMNDPLKILQWLRWLLSELRVGKVLDTLKYSSAVLGDNTAAHALAENPVASSRSKHIAIKYHYVRHLRSCKVIHLCHVDSASNCSDLMSKPVVIDINTKLAPQVLGHVSFVKCGDRELKLPSDEYM